VDERVSGLGLVRSALGQSQEPARVLLPRVLLQESVLINPLRLNVAPSAVQHVALGFDELPSVGHPPSVRGIGSHELPHTLGWLLGTGARRRWTSNGYRSADTATLGDGR